MMPWRQMPISSSVAEVFNGLVGEARAKAIATGNYKALIQQQIQPDPEREPGEDAEEAA